MSDQMMAPAGFLFMGGVGLLLLLSFLGLVVFLLRPARTMPANLMEFIGQQPTRSRFSTVETLPEAAFIVLADISGYTAFMQGSRFAADHAQYLVLTLLEAVVDAAEPILRFLKVEGDAVLFIRESGDPQRTGQAISEALAEMAVAFHVEKQALQSKNNCPCKACSHVDNLDIKFVVDHGEVGLFSVDQRPDASGMPLIRAHRLLKAERGPGHLIVTDPASDFVPAPWADPLETRFYELEGLGSAKAHFATIPSNLEAFREMATKSNSSLARKLVFNLKHSFKPMRQGNRASPV